MDTNSNDQTTVGEQPSEWEKDGATSLCEALGFAALGVTDGPDIGLVRGYLGDVPVAVLTLSREEGDMIATTPVAVMLMGDNGARVVEQLTFPGMGTLSKNPDYAGPVPANA